MFVVALRAEDVIVFRTRDARALRKVCRSLRWGIVSDTTLSTDDFKSTWRSANTSAS